MKKKTIFVSVISIITIILVYFLFFNTSDAGISKFIFASITRENLSTTITSTGTLQAVTTVDVGTQVSGKIDRLLVDFITSKSNYETSVANLSSAKSSLAQAKNNLGYAYIYSPIKGIINNRNIEEGQIVASSLTAPTLFTIAEDLSKMQILTNVDESDIGQIKVGQDAQFTVQAYHDKKFFGKVFHI